MTRAAHDVAVRAIDAGRAEWGERLVAAYAIGSLAHGGFSEKVSDIDVALIVTPPLQASDAARADAVKRVVAASGLPLAERLSLFWSCFGPSAPGADAGRLPAPDLLDLRRHGRLLHGREVREYLAAPTYRDLLLSSATFGLRRLADEAGMAYLRDPASLVRGGIVVATKFVLYPVRLLYSAQTGEVDGNPHAVQHFAAFAPASARALAIEALGWRDDPSALAAPQAADALQAGLRPLYRLFVDEYARRLGDHGESPLMQRYREWSSAIAALTPGVALRH